MKTLLIAAIAFRCASLFAVMPSDHRALTRTISYAEMKTFLESVDGKGPVHVSIEGTSTKGRSVYLVRLARSANPAWKIVYYAQQHGDEISSKDALLYLIRDIAAHPEKLPADTGVWILPMMNPDGAEAGTRVSGAGVDLNRDHITLEQPETQALYRVIRRVRPDIAVDCHEFGRASEAWRKTGWEKWPDITMDRLNNPLFDAARVAAGERWFAEAAKAEAAAGHPFLRYTVGGAPPDDEQRHSAPEIDSAMNAVGTYGGLSFIIEAAARDGSEVIARELGNRVDAYLVLFRMFIHDDGHRAEDREAIRKARTKHLPPFLPTNYPWVNAVGTVTHVPVTEVATHRTIDVPTMNMMTTVAVKKSVTTPIAYVVEARAAGAIGALLDRHAIPYETLTSPRSFEVEACTLLRLEDQFDDVYSRYEGRQIVHVEPLAKRELPAGSLLVPLRGETALRAALVLEPAAFYGIYQYANFRSLVASDGALPVLRVMR
ncbi:MAG: M14 family zinc carboxypeptidase [Thermoanaerobaculia bacterium]